MVEYGVDWDAHQNKRLMQHLYNNNPGENQAAESFHLPTHMARVECEPPRSPFSPEEMNFLRSQLAARASDVICRRDMPSRRLLWGYAFSICAEIRALR